uniref:CLOCK-interacting pacemaker-like n=1 Tax=Stegastes partitus TaxID=144197 RepID=A0A3B5A718_9TELE
MNSKSDSFQHNETHMLVLLFSDASSEYLSTVELTDSEDAGRNGSISRRFIVSYIADNIQFFLMGNKTATRTIFFLQPSSMAPAEKQWGFPSPLDVMPQSQLVLLQPMVSNGNSSSPPKASAENTRQSKNYMPILKSYPRIAPHPVDTPTKRVGSSRVRGSATSGYDQRQRRHHHGHRPYSSPSPLPALQTTAQPISNFEAATNQAQAAESQEQLADKSLSALVGSSSLLSFSDEFRTVTDSNEMPADKYQDVVSMHSNKLKRFSNTYNILNKSGLLGITMRTKQLIKENKRTQGQLQQLQEQTALLLEALSSGDPQLWTKLQLSLQDTEKEQWGANAQRVLPASFKRRPEGVSEPH